MMVLATPGYLGFSSLLCLFIHAYEIHAVAVRSRFQRPRLAGIDALVVGVYPSPPPMGFPESRRAFSLSPPVNSRLFIRYYRRHRKMPEVEDVRPAHRRAVSCCDGGRASVRSAGACPVPPPPQREEINPHSFHSTMNLFPSFMSAWMQKATSPLYLTRWNCVSAILFPHVGGWRQSA